MQLETGKKIYASTELCQLATVDEVDSCGTVTNESVDENVHSYFFTINSESVKITLFIISPFSTVVSLGNNRRALSEDR